jgi:hypothetical protein
MNKDDLIKLLKNQKEQIRYWQNKVNELEIKMKSLEDYNRGFVDATYYLGGKK